MYKQNDDEKQLTLAVDNDPNPPKHPGGRPPHVWSQRIADKLHCGLTFGIPVESIGNYVGLSYKTLQKYYGDIIETKKADQNEAVKCALFYQATVLNIPASTIFWLRMKHDEFADKPKDVETKNNEIIEYVMERLPD